jgi:type VI secretion system protein ImpE
LNDKQDAELSLREGRLDQALDLLQQQVRSSPSAPELRIFLFQLLAVMGQWQRALIQLRLAGELQASALAMVQLYAPALHCELLRAEVFAGRRSPLILGQPEEWLAWLVESLQAAGQGRFPDSERLRERAFETAPPCGGSINGVPFGWIADADMRLGPVCEAIIEGRYYWLPFERLSRISIEPPSDLRDAVWMPAHFEFANGGSTVGLIPTRYPGSERHPDSAIRMSRRTEWTERGKGVYFGLGQRVLATDSGDHALMDLQEIFLDPGRQQP